MKKIYLFSGAGIPPPYDYKCGDYKDLHVTLTYRAVDCFVGLFYNVVNYPLESV